VDYLAGIVAELTGAEPSDAMTLRSVGSLMSQALIYVRRNPVAERLGFPFHGTQAEIDAAARHIAEFSIGGIKAVSRHVAARAAVRRSSRMRGRR